MQLNRASTYEVENTQPVIGKTAVSVYNVSHTMRMLAETTYSHPIDAVVRETIANAVDACKNQKPIKIVCPSVLEPNFKVRDFGVGMTEEFFLDGYSKLGFSTKSASNEEIGGFGQGRFAPFAYKGCDVFYVRSVKDGKWFLGAIERDENFEVFVSVHSRGNSDEENGTEIIVPVLKADYTGFQVSVSKYTEFLTVKPICTVEPNQSRVAVEGKGWTIHGFEYSGSNFRAVMGGIPYRLSLQQIGVGTPLYGSVHSATFFFDIGDLAVSNSREELRYDNQTKAVLKHHISEMRAEIEARIETRGKQLKTEWEHWTDPEITALKTAIGTHVAHNLYCRAQGGVILAQSVLAARNSQGYSNAKEKCIRVTGNREFKIFVADIPRWRSRYVHLLQTAGWADNAYVIVVRGMNTLNTFLGGAPHTLMSQLLEPPKVVRPKVVSGTPKEKRKTKLFRYNGDAFQLDRYVTSYTGHEVYVPLDLTVIQDEYKTLFSMLPGLVRRKLVGVPRADLKVAEQAGWVRFDDWLRQSVTQRELEAYTVWVQIRHELERGYEAVTRAHVLAVDGFMPPPFMHNAYHVFQMLSFLKDLADKKWKYKVMLYLGCPPLCDNSLEFNTAWKAFRKAHPVFHKALDHNTFDAFGAFPEEVCRLL